jgi:hypothetical protein
VSVKTTALPDVLALQCELNALALDVTRLREQITALQADRDERLRRRLSQADVLLLQRLLPPLSGAWGDERFRASYVLDDPGLARFVAGFSVKALGRLLARATGVPIGRYVLVDCGRDDGARCWRICGLA